MGTSFSLLWPYACIFFKEHLNKLSLEWWLFLWNAFHNFWVCQSSFTMQCLNSFLLVLKRATWNSKKLTSFTNQISNLMKFEFDSLQFWENGKWKSTKLEILKMFGKLVSKLKLKPEKFIFTELNMCSNSEFSSSMKLVFVDIWAYSSTFLLFSLCNECHSLG